MLTNQLLFYLQKPEPPDEASMLFVLVGVIVIIIFVFIYYYIKLKFGNQYNLGLRFVQIKPEFKEALRKYCIFYNLLPDKDKILFEKRVQHFIFAKEYIPRQIKEVTPEMKALIAASAIQITFGLPYIYLAHFQKILVYPSDYYSTITRRYHKGEVNPGTKAIVLSWQHFLQGIMNPIDSINLGLHEMAHALWLENKILNKEYGFLQPQVLTKYNILANLEMLKIQSGAESLFREYAGQDKFEFFAVAIENFFEKPYEFSRHMPELYRVMCLLLNQDPLKLYSEEFLEKYKASKA